MTSSPSRPSPPRPADTEWRARALELDRAHQGRLRSAAGLLLSLRFLGTALGRLVHRPARVARRMVAHPPAGVVAVTFVGHATVMITTPAGRVLTDPLLRTSLLGLRRAREAGIADADLNDVGVVLISHAHRDHLDRASLARLSRRATVILPPGCADLVADLGFEHLVELAPGQRFKAGDVETTAVPVRHSGGRGLGRRARRRGAAGYVIESQGTTVYFAGDTGYFSGFADIGRRLHPDVALLPISGYEPAGFRDQHLSPLDAIYAFEDLGARVLIPIAHGSFPLSYEPLAAPLDWLRHLAQERRLAGGRAGNQAGGSSAAIESEERRVAPLEHGETCFFRKRA
ncbi:MAG TPA: MBL fold metallo-hydrolase [Polyangia bacterium]|nr:MBL fold metallo-hydrolase [Polyangia bacterium]